MKKKYKYKAKDYKKRVEKYWARIDEITSAYWVSIDLLEKEISKDLGITEIEIFHSDNDVVGIGNLSRDMELIHMKY